MFKFEDKLRSVPRPSRFIDSGFIRAGEGFKHLVSILILICLLIPAACASSGGKYDLDDFGYRTVKTNGRGSLVFQEEPRGDFMYGHKFWDGDRIYVNVEYRKNGYALAYDDGVYGYVDASYIDWDEDDSRNDWDDDGLDLSEFEYRTVDIDGSGALIFQRSPGGAFMNQYKYWDGDRIYVNVDYREDGYAIAYEDGVYGYVDARYIDW